MMMIQLGKIIHVMNGLVYSSFAYLKQQQFRSYMPFPGGLSYDLYLYHTTAYNNLWARVNGSSRFRPSYFQSPWDMVISVQSGTTQRGFFVKKISLPDNQIKADFNLISEAKDYWRYYFQDRNEYKTNVPNMIQGLISCFYRPMIIVDFSPLFQYK